MGHSMEYEHLQPDVDFVPWPPLPESPTARAPRTIVLSGGRPVAEMAVYDDGFVPDTARPSLWQRIRDAFAWRWS